MEVCLAQYWSEVKDVRVHLKLTFHSVQPSFNTITFVSCYSLWYALTQLHIRICSISYIYICISHNHASHLMGNEHIQTDTKRGRC